MKVLSLFDGISVCRSALAGVGIVPEVYYASEIDKYAERISASNWSEVDRLGSVSDYPFWKHFRGVDGIDLLTAGSPCQGFSLAGKHLAFDDPRSKLYFDFVECIKEFRPKWVMLENVMMKGAFQDVISETMQAALDGYGGGTLYKTHINSSLVSAQNRKRIYWTNWPVRQPEDRGILLRDILLSDGRHVIKQRGEWQERGDKSQCLDASYYKGADNHGQRSMIDLSELEVDASKYAGLLTKDIDSGKPNVLGNLYPGKGQNGNVYSVDGKSKTLSAGTGIKGRGVGSSNSPKIIDDYNQRVKTDGKSCTLTPNSGASAFRNGQKVVEWKERDDGKANALLASYASKGASKCDVGRFVNKAIHNFVEDDDGKDVFADGPRIRKLHPIECERLQGLPDNYTLVQNADGKQVVSNTQRYKTLGNGWQRDTIEHVFSCNAELCDA